LLLGAGLTPEQREAVEIIRTSGEELLTIINDVLDYSKIEAGKMGLERAPFALRECLESAVDLVAMRAAEKQLDLAWLIEDGVPDAIVGDATRLRQIVVNLLANAVKFTERGEVVLSVEVEPDEQAAARPPGGGTPSTLHIRVQDTGIGIPPDRLDRLFQTFSQIDDATTRRYGGTGLGLAICKRLCELMGGRIWVASEVGRGSTFHVTIPVETVAGGEPTRDLAGAQPSLFGKRLLVVADSATSRLQLVRQTQAWGMVTLATGSPDEALAWIRQGDQFDVAILDARMPGMDAVRLATEIHVYRDPATLPLVLASSLGRRETAAEDGHFAASLTMPIKPSQLLNVLAGLFAEQPATTMPETQPLLDPEMAARVPLRILVADDNANNQTLLVRVLARLGYEAEVAGNGFEVIAALEGQRYDVVLLDVQMPKMDGLEAARQIGRRWSRAERPQLVAMTADALPGDRERCLAAGMDDYLSKPISLEELVRALSDARTVGETETGTAVPAPASD
jgi:CheY-like chemotaxis protein/anti-sigma regulatory factor (Ser/Thr protein kinase)